MNNVDTTLNCSYSNYKLNLDNRVTTRIIKYSFKKQDSIVEANKILQLLGVIGVFYMSFSIIFRKIKKNIHV